MEDLILELKKELISALNLVDLSPDDIKDDEQLFGEGLGLDSIDALEIILLVEKKYGLRIKNSAEDRQIFASVRSLATYIQTNRDKCQS